MHPSPGDFTVSNSVAWAEGASMFQLVVSGSVSIIVPLIIVSSISAFGSFLIVIGLIAVAHFCKVL